MKNIEQFRVLVSRTVPATGLINTIYFVALTRNDAREIARKWYQDTVPVIQVAVESRLVAYGDWIVETETQES